MLVLAKRVFTAVVLLVALILLVTFSSPFVFAIVIGLAVLLAALEWTQFVGLSSLQSKLAYLLSLLVLMLGLFFLLGINPTATELDQTRVISILVLGVVFWCVAVLLIRGYPENESNWNDQSHIALMGVFVLLPTWVGIVQLKYLDNSGFALLALIALVSVADIAAYFTGNAWGKTKFAPRLSPKKSWAGLWGGMFSCIFLSLILLIWINVFLFSTTLTQSIAVVVCSVVVFASSVVGDLFESMMKRNRQLKDSGKILPGHGGILDRVDSLTAATPISVILLLIIFGTSWMH